MINTLLRKARHEVETHGRILVDTAAHLMACGVIVEPLERRLIEQVGSSK